VSNASSYHVWYPTVERSGDIVQLLLTRGRLRTAPLPISGPPFFGEVLSAAGVEANVVSGGIDPFLTSYFTGEWEECWELRILVDGSARLPAGAEVAGAPVHGDPQAAGEANTAAVWVLADFDRRKDATACQKQLRDERDKGPWDEIRHDRVRIRDVGARHKQVVVELSTYKREVPDVIAAAERFATVCADHGGRLRAQP
jgi:hypothetical protein